jgi:hypothetical protein
MHDRMLCSLKESWGGEWEESNGRSGLRVQPVTDANGKEQPCVSDTNSDLEVRTGESSMEQIFRNSFIFADNDRCG